MKLGQHAGTLATEHEARLRRRLVFRRRLLRIGIFIAFAAAGWGLLLLIADGLWDVF